MSLPILLIMVVVGVSAVGLAVHLSGGSRNARLAGEDAARARYGEDFPDDKVERVIMASGCEGAILRLAGGAVGIVHCFGDRFVTRRLVPGATPEIRVDGPRGFSLLLYEYTWPKVQFRFDDGGAMRQALAALGVADDELERAG